MQPCRSYWELVATEVLILHSALLYSEPYIYTVKDLTGVTGGFFFL